MKYIWVAEYKKDGKWIYIGADPKCVNAELLVQSHKFTNDEMYWPNGQLKLVARVRRFEYTPAPRKSK